MPIFDTSDIQVTGLTAQGRTILSGNSATPVLIVSGASSTIMTVNDNAAASQLFGVSTTANALLFSVTTGGPQLSSGSTTVAPFLVPTGGTLLTTAIVGAFEIDSGSTPYYTFALGSRGVMKTEQILFMTGTTTLSSTTVSQPLFTASTSTSKNGTVNIQAGYSYAFECSFDVSGTSASSGFVGFGLSGSSTLSTIRYVAQTTKGPTNFVTASTVTDMVTVRTRATTQITTASTGTAASAWISGVLRCSGSGTLRPDISLSVAAAAIVGQDSYFKISPMGPNGLFQLGSWT